MATIAIRGDIGTWEGAISASQFIGELERLDADEPLRLRVNSDGGSAFEAMSMASALHRHRGHITAEIEGVAASAATFLVMSADAIEMFEPALLMVHRASAGGIGNAEDLRQLAGTLEIIDDAISTVYASRSGGSKADWAQAMASETWFNSGEVSALFGAKILPVKGPGNVTTAKASKAAKSIANRSSQMRGLVNRLTSGTRHGYVNKQTRAKLAEYAARIDQIRARELADARSYNRACIGKYANTAAQAKRYLGWS